MTIQENKYYIVLDSLKEKLIEAGFSTVTYGDITEIDIAKQNIYPLAHLVQQTAVMGDKMTGLSITILGADIVSFQKNGGGSSVDDKYYGKDNRMDVSQDILARLQTVISKMEQDATLYPLDITYPLTFQPFFDSYEEKLAGWVLDIVINIPNINTC